MKQVLFSCIAFGFICFAAAQSTENLTLTLSPEQYGQMEQHFAQKQKERQRHADWAQFDRYAEANRNVASAPKVVFMGNSITEGWAKKRPDFFATHDFVGRGISGQTSSHMLVRFQADVIALKPKYVVILAGTNDIAQNNGTISQEHIMENIRSMCELAMAHRIKPVLCSVLPAARFSWNPTLQPAEDIKALNVAIKAYAARKRIPYVDFYSALVDDQGGLPAEYAADGVHPTAEGYAVMENILLKTLK